MDELLNLIGKSKITLIGYTTEYKNIKNELLSNISFYEIKTINSSFSIKNDIRNFKLNSIFDNTLPITHILINPLNFLIDKSDKWTQQPNYFQLILNQIIFDLKNTDYKIIITSSMYKSISNNYNYNFKGGLSSLYLVELAFIFSEINDNIYAHIIKNRLGNFDKILIK